MNEFTRGSNCRNVLYWFSIVNQVCVFTAGVDPSSTSNGASISPNRAKASKHSHTVQFVSTTNTVRAPPQSSGVNKNVTTFQSELPRILYSSNHCGIVNFTGVNNSMIGGDQFILVVVGASAGALFLLGFIVIVTLLCLWRCLHVHSRAESSGMLVYTTCTYGACYIYVHTWCIYILFIQRITYTWN